MAASISSESMQLDIVQIAPKQDIAQKAPKQGRALSIHSASSGKIVGTDSQKCDDKEAQKQKTEYHGEDLELLKTKGPEATIGRKAAILLFIGLAMATFLASLDGTIIATALPKIASDFKAQSKMFWVATAYLLTYNAFQPLYGKFSDIFGRKFMILFASVVFMVGSAGAGGARSMTTFIAFRAIQGLGDAGLLSIVLIIISDIFPLEERPKYQSIIWIVTIVSVLLFLRLPFNRQRLKEQLARIDYLGTFLIIVAVICLLLPIIWGGRPWCGCNLIGTTSLAHGPGVGLSSIGSGAMLSKIGDYRIFIWIGTTMMTIGIGLCMLLDAESRMGQQTGFLLIVGLGIGLILQTCMLAAQTAVEKKDMVVVTALCGFMNSIGGGIGIAMCSALFNNQLVQDFSKFQCQRSR
ncbi:hypothetical protein BGX28_003820 [Mortierella sp. GBA30]|nr:hypothetical protein BGX28_003820 [Mortierella sp. GBA30]